MQCTNIECGHTYKAALSVVGTVSPSAMPDARVVIPMLPKRPTLPGQPAIVPDNDDERVAANDTSLPAAAARDVTG